MLFSVVVVRHKHKKLKADSLNPKIHPSSSIQASGEIVQNFVTALKCWELLHSDMLEKGQTEKQMNLTNCGLKKGSLVI